MPRSAADILCLRSEPGRVTRTTSARVANRTIIEEAHRETERLRSKIVVMSKAWKSNAKSHDVLRSQLQAQRLATQRARETESEASATLRTLKSAIPGEITQINLLCETAKRSIHAYEGYCQGAVDDIDALERQLHRAWDDRDRVVDRIEQLVSRTQVEMTHVEAELVSLDREIERLNAENELLRNHLSASPALASVSE